MSREALIRKHFPFSDFNPGQLEAIDDILSAVERGVRHIVVEAPTGVGKSAIATTVHKVLAEVDDFHRTTLITGTKGLQDQYVADDASIYDLKGRANYSCMIGDHTYNSPACKSALVARRCGVDRCPYVQRRDSWLYRADLRLSNASFVITCSDDMIASDTTASNLMIIDECHELPNHLINHATVKVSKYAVSVTRKQYGEAFDEMFNNFMGVIAKIKEGSAFRLVDIDPSMHVSIFYNKMKNVLAASNARIQSGDTTPSLLLISEELSDVVGSMEVLVTQRDSEWILTAYEKGVGCEMKPVYAHQVARRGIFSKCAQFVHMSATICGFKEYCNNLGIPEHESVFIQVPNPIPVKNRMVVVCPGVSMNNSTPIADVISYVDRVIDKQKPEENGIIHTVSFKLANEIKLMSKHRKRMLVSNNRAEILNELSKKGRIIVTPSAETGYDFKGDLARWQIIAKVPYGYLGDPYVKLNMQRDSSWYARQAILRLVQASGRVSRGIGDFGVTYIIDSNVNRLIYENHEMFPEWYMDALIIPK